MSKAPGGLGIPTAEVVAVAQRKARKGRTVRRKRRRAEVRQVTAVSPSDGEGKRIVTVSTPGKAGEMVAVGDETGFFRLYPDGIIKRIGSGLTFSDEKPPKK